MILVTGASGTVGSEVTRQLVDAGQPVRVLARDPRKVAALKGLVDVATGDLDQPETVARYAGRERRVPGHLPGQPGSDGAGRMPMRSRHLLTNHLLLKPNYSLRRLSWLHRMPYRIPSARWR